MMYGLIVFLTAIDFCLRAYLWSMNQGTSSQPPSWLKYASWIPVLAYFAIKYLLFKGDMAGRQQMLLFGAVILAEVALWQYKKQFRQTRNSDNDGSD